NVFRGRHDWQVIVPGQDILKKRKVSRRQFVAVEEQLVDVKRDVDEVANDDGVAERLHPDPDLQLVDVQDVAHLDARIRRMRVQTSDRHGSPRRSDGEGLSKREGNRIGINQGKRERVVDIHAAAGGVDVDVQTRQT